MKKNTLAALAAFLVFASLLSACDSSTMVSEGNQETYEDYVLPEGNGLSDEELSAAKTAIASYNSVRDILLNVALQVSPSIETRIKGAGNEKKSDLKRAVAKLKKELKKGDRADQQKLERLAKTVETIKASLVTFNEDTLYRAAAARILQIDPEFGSRSLDANFALYGFAGKEDCQHCTISYTLKVVATHTATAVGIAACGPAAFICAGLLVTAELALLAAHAIDLDQCLAECHEQFAIQAKPQLESHPLRNPLQEALLV